MDKVFYWSGVWAIMVYGTVAVCRIYRAVRRKLRERNAVRYVRLNLAADDEADKTERPEDNADADAEGD